MRPAARFWLFALIAIVLPAAIVAVLAVLSLRQWASSAELLFREQARDVAAMAADKIAMVLRRTEEEVLARLQAALSADEGSRLARVITRESERLSRLIDNVLDFSRIEGGRRTYERLPTAVEPLVRDAVEAFSYPLAQQGFKVEVEVAADLPDVALDVDAVGQALANLIDNAIKYSAERKVLRVGARLVGGRLALSVADQGVGIPREEHARIFDKFYRVGRSETQGRRGSGMGLALVRHVAQAHGGEITVESRPGEGSRFTLWLPG